MYRHSAHGGEQIFHNAFLWLDTLKVLLDSANDPLGTRESKASFLLEGTGPRIFHTNRTSTMDYGVARRG